MKNEELRMKNEELRMKNEELRMKNEDRTYAELVTYFKINEITC